MRYHHLYSDETGTSRWKTVDVALSERQFAPPAKSIHVSEAEPARTTLFLRLHAGWDEPIHTTPKRQTLIVLKGRIAVTASDGETREIGPGDVWRMEDTTGAGHRTQVLGSEDLDAVIVQFD